LHSVLTELAYAQMKLVRLVRIYLYGTYSKVRIIEHLCFMFPIPNGLTHEDALSPMPFNSASECAISNVRENKVESNLIWI
jgi:hypothetical protein